MLRNLLENIDTKKLVAFGSIALLLVLVLVLVFGNKPSEDADVIPFEGTSQDYTKRARIVGGEKLFRELEGDKRYDSFSEDIFKFGSTAYPEYKELKDSAIGFTIEEESKNDSGEIILSGTYGSSSNKVEVKLNLLKNYRLQTSITDTKTELNIDDQLPSNSKFNLYISTLPLDEEGYYAEYSEIEDKLTIYIDERDPSLSTRAVDDIKSKIGDDSYDSSRVEILFPPPSIGN